MDSPDSRNYDKFLLTPNLVERLSSQKRKVLGDIQKLNFNNGIKDEADRRIVELAFTFVENPTENLQEIMSYTTAVAQVLAGYMQIEDAPGDLDALQGDEAPAEIDALHGYLLAMQCLNRISFIENEIEKGNINTPEIQQAINRAFEWASIISRGYKDHAYLLDAVNELKDRLNSFKN